VRGLDNTMQPGPLHESAVQGTAAPEPAVLTCPAQHRPSVFAPCTYGYRPLSAFRIHAPISVDLVTAHTCRHSAPGGLPSVLADYSHCVLAYQAAVALRCGHAPHDVCWHVQLPWHVAPGVPLSFSTQMGSAECFASFNVAATVASLEIMLLMRERSLVQSAGRAGAHIHAVSWAMRACPLASLTRSFGAVYELSL
jgi:hypothetical protein